MNNYVKYTLYLEEPLKLGRQGSQGNSISLDYIPGSSLRGAVIGAYLQENQEDELGELLRNVNFYDAYVMGNGQMLIPVPQVYYVDKHRLRSAQKKAGEGVPLEYQITACADVDTTPEPGSNRVDIGHYCYLRGNELAVKTVHKTANLHIALRTENEESKMFRYEAIDEGQSFTGIIQCEDAARASQLQQLITGKVFYLGGSRGSGYGRCRVVTAECSNWKAIHEELLGEQSVEHETENVLRVYALSNLILTDEWGRPTGRIAEDIIEEQLHITDVKLQKSYVSTFLTSGFNHTWKARQTQQSAVMAGSVYVYTYRGQLDTADVMAWEEKGVGGRKQEGFGRFLLNPCLNQELRTPITEEYAARELPMCGAEEQSILSAIGYRILAKREEEALDRRADGVAGKSRSGMKSLSVTQLSRLWIFVDSIAAMTSDEMKHAVPEFLDSLRGKTKDAYAKATISGLDVKNSKALEKVLGELYQDNQTWKLDNLSDNSKELSELFYLSRCEHRALCNHKALLLSKALYTLMRMRGEGKRDEVLS